MTCRSKRWARRAGWLLAPLLAAAIAAPPAGAADPDAPPGARDTWLPGEAWVQRGWLPYRERTLYRLLGLSRRRLAAIIATERHSIAAVAARRGWRPETFARRLVDDWAGRLPEPLRRELRDRALRTLTQPHLGRHMLHHTFHRRAIRKTAPRIFGTSRFRYSYLRDRNLTPYEIGARYGRSRPQVWRAALAALSHEARRGRASGVTPRSQSLLVLRRQREWLDAWLSKPRRGRRKPNGGSESGMSKPVGPAASPAAASGAALCVLAS